MKNKFPACFPFQLSWKGKRKGNVEKNHPCMLQAEERNWTFFFTTWEWWNNQIFDIGLFSLTSRSQFYLKEKEKSAENCKFPMYIGKEKEKRWEFLTVKEQDNHRPNFVWLIFFIHNTIIAYFPGEISIFFRKKVFRIYEVFSTYQLIFFFNLQFSALFNDRRSLKTAEKEIENFFELFFSKFYLEKKKKTG